MERRKKLETRPSYLKFEEKMAELELTVILTFGDVRALPGTGASIVMR